MPFVGLFALPVERGPMNDRRPCKNFLEGSYSESCNRWIEDDRPKWAKYCKTCGTNRSKDWKHEHPERAKLYSNEEAVKNWLEHNDWNFYVKVRRQSQPTLCPDTTLCRATTYQHKNLTSH